MKFITEEELRDRYRKEPFTVYELAPETKLTPGARQFLTDLRIDIHGDAAFPRDRSVSIKAETAAGRPHGFLSKAAGTYGGQTKKVTAKLKSAESLFLLTCKELLDRDVVLAQEAIVLERQFSGIRAAIEGKGQFEGISCRECSGINSENFDKEIGDCFEISEFHMRLENGTEILNLHRLRCAICEIEAFMPGAYEDGSDENGSNETGLYLEVIARINMIINSLSRMICTAVGGKKCLRIR